MPADLCWLQHRARLTRVFIEDPKLTEKFNEFLTVFLMRDKPCNHGVKDTSLIEVYLDFDDSKIDKTPVRDLPADVVKCFRDVVALFHQVTNRINVEKCMNIRGTQKSLPIAAEEANIIATLGDHQILILAGDTGCGKSTQIPRFNTWDLTN
uniref:AAA_6 domain-containing protein n=1 Tax=Panagrellus redivivus TaxID=6233 RepID=A0A7E4W080_PANRE